MLFPRPHCCCPIHQPFPSSYAFQLVILSLNPHPYFRTRFYQSHPLSYKTPVFPTVFSGRTGIMSETRRSGGSYRKRIVDNITDITPQTLPTHGTFFIYLHRVKKTFTSGVGRMASWQLHFHAMLITVPARWLLLLSPVLLAARSCGGQM